MHSWKQNCLSSSIFWKIILINLVVLNLCIALLVQKGCLLCIEELQWNAHFSALFCSSEESLVAPSWLYLQYSSHICHWLNWCTNSNIHGSDIGVDIASSKFDKDVWLSIPSIRIVSSIKINGQSRYFVFFYNVCSQSSEFRALDICFSTDISGIIGKLSIINRQTCSSVCCSPCTIWWLIEKCCCHFSFNINRSLSLDEIYLQTIYAKCHCVNRLCSKWTLLIRWIDCEWKCSVAASNWNKW